MGFFDRFNDSKYRRIGENLASSAFSMCTHDQINTLLLDCMFSDSEKTRFKFDYFIANLVVAAHAVNSVVCDLEKAEKIIEPMFSMLDRYLKKIITDDIRIGDFIANDNEWKYLRQYYQINNPDMKTNCSGLLDLIYNYRRQRYFEALLEGIEIFIEKQNFLGPMSSLVRLFVQNFPSSEENTNNFIVTLCPIFTATHHGMMEYCKKEGL